MVAARRSVAFVAALLLVACADRSQATEDIHAVIVDAETGAPMVDATVKVTGQLEDGVATTEMLTADRSGRFVSRRRWHKAVLTISAPGRADFKVGHPGGIRAIDGVIRLSRRHSLRGQVIAAESGMPLAGAAIIQTHARTDIRNRTIRLDGGGYFHVNDLPAGNAVVTISSRGRAPQTLTLALPMASDVDVLRFRLLKAVTIDGAVTDADGRPISDARVSVVYDRADRTYRALERLVEQRSVDGGFRLAGIQPLIPFRVEARSGAGTASVAIPPRSAGEIVSGLRLTLQLPR